MENKLKIAEPCHENWSDMTSVEKGKHCAVCSKQVVDFTENSREEIIDFLDEAEGQTCGRFKEGQIDIYGNDNNAIKKTIIPFYKTIAASVLAVLGAGTATAQDGEYFEMGDVAYEPIEEVVTNNRKVILKGEIKSHNNLLENAKVSIYSGSKLITSILTNSTGKYHFEIEKGVLANNQYTMKVFAAGFESKTIDNLEALKAEITMNLSMEYEMMVMGEVMMEPEVILEGVRPIEKGVTETEKVEKFFKGKVCVIDTIKEEKIIEKDSVEYTIGTIVLTENPVNEIEAVDITKTDSIEEKKVIPEISNPLEVTVYPNPSASQVFVRTNKPGEYQYGVTDLIGKLIFSGTKRGETFELNFVGKPNGIYLISIYQNGVAIETKRVIISH